MKYLFKHIFFYSFMLIILSGCSDKDIEQLAETFELEYESLAAPNTGTKEALLVHAPGRWTASTEEPWLQLSPASGSEGTLCELKIDPSVLNEAREGKIRFASETGESKTLTVTQFGFEKAIILSTKDTIIESSGAYGERYTVVEVSTNVELTHQIVDAQSEAASPAIVNWLSIANAQELDLEESGARPQQFELRLDWQNNLEPIDRAARVVFNSAELSEPVSLVVRQKAGPVITDDATGDSLALLIVYDKLNMMRVMNTDEKLAFWDGVTLWDKTDSEVKENPELLGRIRKLNIAYFQCKEPIPVEIGKIKHLESLYIGTNANKFQLSIDLSESEDGIAELVGLKELTIFSYGLTGDLPAGWSNLTQLESLSLAGNNFSTWPASLTAANFPALKNITFTGNRRYSAVSLNPLARPLDEIGLHIDSNSELFKSLLHWEKLEYLGFSNCILEGNIPTATDLGISEVYTAADFAEKGDTLNYLIGKPKVMPNLKTLRLNLNFLNGEIPEWILCHPNLMYMDPFTLIYKQDGNKKNSEGEQIGFDNVPENWNYYWDMFPLLKPSRDN